MMMTFSAAKWPVSRLLIHQSSFRSVSLLWSFFFWVSHSPSRVPWGDWGTLVICFSFSLQISSCTFSPSSRDSVVIFQGVILVIFALTRIWPSNIRPFPSLAKFCRWTWYGTASLIGKCLGRADGQSCKFARQQRTL